MSPEGSDLIFDHRHNAEKSALAARVSIPGPACSLLVQPIRSRCSAIVMRPCCASGRRQVAESARCTQDHKTNTAGPPMLRFLNYFVGREDVVCGDEDMCIGLAPNPGPRSKRSSPEEIQTRSPCLRCRQLGLSGLKKSALALSLSSG